MMKHLRLLFTMLMLTLLGGSYAWADTVTFTAGTDTSEGTSITKDGITISFSSGVFNRADNYRCYANQSMTISAASGITITQVDFTATSGNPMTNFSESNYPDTGAWTDDSQTQWTGSASKIEFGRATSQVRISEVVVTCTTSSTSAVATPTFNPEAGTYAETQEVTISTTTSGATIYYTLNGENPTTSSNVHSSPITIDETTTIKAIAVKDGMNNSEVAEATYTIVSAEDGWIETSLAELTEDDVFVIVGNNGNNYAMSNGNGTESAPSAISVSIVGDKLVGNIPDNIKWNVSGDADGYTFYPDGDAEKWLYCTNSNNGVRVGVNNGKTFTISGGYLLHSATSRYVGVYSSQDWRCYTSINDNIKDQTFKFYKNPTVVPSVAKPIFSPAGGEFTEAQTVTISCSTADATIYYTTDGTEPTNQSTPYSGAISVEETTTIKAIAYVGTDASQVATATYTIKAPQTLITIAEARAQETGEVFTSGVVTSKNGSTVYIQDETAAIVVYGNNSVKVGDAITVEGTLTTFNGLLEIGNPVISVTSQGNEVTPEVMAIADISNDNQAKLIKIEDATVTEIDGQNVTISQDENTIVVRFNSANDITFEEGDVISLTGNIGCYNAPQIANPSDVVVAGQTEDTLPLPFYESFDTNEGTGGNDGSWNGSIATSNIVYDNKGWTGKNVKGANECAKAGSGNDGGSLTTPNLSFEAGMTYKLTFKAAAWDANNEKTTLNISSTSGTLNKTSVEMEKGAWTEYTIYLSDATAAGSITFSTSSSNNRFFLDEVEIEESNVVPVTIGETGYATLYYSDKALDIPEDVRVSIVTSVDKGSITLEELEQRTIPAGTAVVLQGVAGDYEFTVSDEDLDAPTINMLKGSDAAALTVGDGKFYQLSLNAAEDAESIGFYYGAENGAAFTNGAHKAYLVVPAGQANAKGYSFNGLVTAICNISTMAENAEIYTIGGVRVSGNNLPKGIYIVNGKKMVVK